MNVTPHHTNCTRQDHASRAFFMFSSILLMLFSMSLLTFNLSTNLPKREYGTSYSMENVNLVPLVVGSRVSELVILNLLAPTQRDDIFSFFINSVTSISHSAVYPPTTPPLCIDAPTP